jgi:hypothetical protein
VHTPLVASGRVITYEQTVRAAARLFHTMSDVDMDVLAQQLAVSRATLYRVAGGRERLLGDVLWRAGERVTREALRSASGTGVDRLLQTTAQFNAEIVGYPPLRRLLQDDPSTAFQVLFMTKSVVHRRFVELWCELFEQAQEAGDLSRELEADELAFVFVRLGESILYADLLSGMEPNLELAAKVQRAVLTSF